MEVLRKQVDHLAEENGKLLGHQNHKQKIEYMVRLKKEITKLQEVRVNHFFVYPSFCSYMEKEG